MPMIHTASLAACRAGGRLRGADGGTGVSAGKVDALTCFQNRGFAVAVGTPRINR